MEVKKASFYLPFQDSKILALYERPELGAQLKHGRLFRMSLST